ncbi:MAG: hypothetical protein KKI08_19885, partial [Armatimonadetes bacterium]|nr:hypothetical protein [Armatimonadota bacterium]
PQSPSPAVVPSQQLLSTIGSHANLAPALRGGCWVLSRALQNRSLTPYVMDAASFAKSVLGELDILSGKWSSLTDEEQERVLEYALRFAKSITPTVTSRVQSSYSLLTDEPGMAAECPMPLQKAVLIRSALYSVLVRAIGCPDQYHCSLMLVADPNAAAERLGWRTVLQAPWEQFVGHRQGSDLEHELGEAFVALRFALPSARDAALRGVWRAMAIGASTTRQQAANVALELVPSFGSLFVSAMTFNPPHWHQPNKKSPLTRLAKSRNWRHPQAYRWRQLVTDIVHQAVCDIFAAFIVLGGDVDAVAEPLAQRIARAAAVGKPPRPMELAIAMRLLILNELRRQFPATQSAAGSPAAPGSSGFARLQGLAVEIGALDAGWLFMPRRGSAWSRAWKETGVWVDGLVGGSLATWWRSAAKICRNDLGICQDAVADRVEDLAKLPIELLPRIAALGQQDRGLRRALESFMVLGSGPLEEILQEAWEATLGLYLRDVLPDVFPGYALPKRKRQR